MKKTTRLFATTVAAATILGSFTCSLSAASNHPKLPAKYESFAGYVLSYTGNSHHTADFNHDGIIDPSDATVMLRYLEAKNDAIKNHRSRFSLQISGTWVVFSCNTDEAYFHDHTYSYDWANDFNNDDKVDEKDARLILEYYNWCCLYDLDPSTYAAEAVKNGWC